MNNNLTHNTSEIIQSKKLLLVVSMIFIYIVIFEFVLIPIKFIPKPSILFDSFISLWDSYNLAALLFSTTSIIYLSLVIGYFLISISSKYLLKIVYEFPGMMNLSVPFKYFSIFFFALLFNLWFSNSLTAEFFFAILVVISFLLSVLNKSSKKTKEEYILTAKSLGLNNNEIYGKVIWKEIEPTIFGGLTALHVSLWMIILIYEFVGKTDGIGSLYYSAYFYNDIGAVVALGILTSLLILIGNMIIKFLHRKLFLGSHSN